MESKLTYEIACRYPNAKVKTENFTSRITGICPETNEYVLRATGGVITDSFIAPFTDCQLILKPLSEISDKEKLMAKIYKGYIVDYYRGISVDMDNLIDSGAAVKETI